MVISRSVFVWQSGGGRKTFNLLVSLLTVLFREPWKLTSAIRVTFVDIDGVHLVRSFKRSILYRNEKESFICLLVCLVLMLLRNGKCHRNSSDGHVVVLIKLAIKCTSASYCVHIYIYIYLYKYSLFLQYAFSNLSHEPSFILLYFYTL